MFKTNKPLILASGSPRRKQFFHDLGLDFKVQTSDIDEWVHDGELPEEFVQRMAKDKAHVVMEQYHDSWVVAADTIVCIDGCIFGKPDSRSSAVKMLMQLTGREHSVMTGFCVGCMDIGMEVTRTVTTLVSFFPFSKEIAEAYVATGESQDKAGAYGIQGKGSFLVEKISGSYTNVVGLPLAELVHILCKHSVILPQK